MSPAATEKDIQAVWAAFDRLKADLEVRYEHFKSEVSTLLDKHHSENRVRLQDIDKQSTANGNQLTAMDVKMARLYGEEGQPGSVDRLTAQVSKLTERISWAAGVVAAVVCIVGWYIAWKK